MGRRLGVLLVLTAVLGVGPLVSPSPALAASDDCATPSLLLSPPSPVDASRPQDAVVAQAETLARNGHLDAALTLYDALLNARPLDARGAAGIAYVAAARAAAAELVATAVHAEQPQECYQNALALDDAAPGAQAGIAREKSKESKGAQGAKAAWDDFFGSWLTPLAGLLLPALVVLTVLLVITRLTTPVVGPEVDAWRERTRRWVWRAGMLLLVLVTVRSVARAAVPGWGGEHLITERARFFSLGVLLAVVVSAVAAARRRHGDQRWLLLPLGAGGILSLIGRRIDDDWWPWALDLVTAALGVVLLAASWGHALRLQVRVQKSGKADAAGTAHVLGALQELGSSPPRGLKTPQQIDVQDLPSTALDALPVGKIKTALKTLVDQLVPSTPWRATIEDGEAGRFVLTLTRNGAIARTVAIDPALFGMAKKPAKAASEDSIPKEPADATTAVIADDDDADVPLTAAAAIVLTELARRHRELRIGLCGATQWDSVAAHVIATRPGAAEPPEVGELLTFAVRRDPKNALARAAYIWHVGRTAATPEAFRALAGRLDELWRALPRPGSDAAAGYTALHMRTAHSLTAVWLNIASFESLPAKRRTIAWSASHRWYLTLSSLIKQSVELGGGDALFADSMYTVAHELHAALAVLAPAGNSVPASLDALAKPPPPTLQALYDRACVEAKKGDLPEALGLLSFVASTKNYKDAAWTDPWFAPFRSGNGSGPLADARERFEELVGPAESSYVEGAGIGTKKQSLLDLGIDTAEDLLLVTKDVTARTDLARSLGVPRGVVDLWRADAQKALGITADAAGVPNGASGQQ